MATPPTPADVLYQEQHVHEDMRSNLIASHVTCFILACTAVCLRFTSRRMSKIKYEADDWLIVAGLLFTTGLMICNFCGIHFGLGRHAILMSNPAGLAQIIISAEVIYNFAMLCIKASILVLYRRIFFVSRAFTIILWVVGVFVFGYSVAQAFAALFQCLPIKANWDPTVKGHCINTDLAATIMAALNVVTDFVLLILPMPLLWKLQMPGRRKIQIMGIFLLGGFVCFASIYRCVVIHNLSLSDPSWSDASTDIWTMVELGIAIVSACLPTMRPLFSRTFHKFGSASEGNEHHKNLTRSSDPSLTLQQSRSNPSQSAKFAHLGVLGNLEKV